MRFVKHTVFMLALIVLIVSAMTTSAHACSVCYGDPNSLMAKGLAMGVATLVAIVGAVLLAFAYFFYAQVCRCYGDYQIHVWSEGFRVRISVCNVKCFFHCHWFFITTHPVKSNTMFICHRAQKVYITHGEPLSFYPTESCFVF